MPPKAVISASKGQTNLFSFFNKVKASPTVDADKPSTPALVADPIVPLPLKLSMEIVTETPAELMAMTKEAEVEAKKRPRPTKEMPSKKKTSRAVVESDDEEWDGTEDISKGVGADDINDTDEDSDYSGSGSDIEESDADSFIVDSDSDSDSGARKKARKTKASTASSGRNVAAKKPPLPSAQNKAPSICIPPKSPNSNRLRDFSFQSPAACSPSTSVSNTPMSQNSADEHELSQGSPQCQGVMAHHLLLPEGVVGPGSHEHNFFEFLLPANRKDKSGRKPGHPDYNPRTLFIPDSFIRNQTPAMAQWWELKSDNMDIVLFFKVGKFYELFHMDADVGMSELDLIYMKGSKAHSGFPEISYGKFASILVTKGYRVARVEQTETPEMLKERNDASRGKKDKVVAREMCSIMSKGTRTYCHLDDRSLLEDSSSLSQSRSILVAVKESVVATDVDGGISNSVEYGICCIDTVIGTVVLAQFQDDQLRSRLRTMLSRYVPSEVLLEAHGHSDESRGVIRIVAPSAIVDTLNSVEMPSEPSVVIDKLDKGQYFQGASEWPPVLAAVREGVKDGSSSLVTSALGGAMWQLTRCLIDFEVLSLGKFYAYVPPDQKFSTSPPGAACGSESEQMDIDNHHSSSHNIFALSASQESPMTPMDVEIDETCPIADGNISRLPRSMTLDAIALGNLEVLQNNFDKTERGSLWAFVNRCKTAFGQRLLKEWLVRPLFRPNEIARRAAAVEELLTNHGREVDRIRDVLKSVPDLERLLSRVHSNGLKKKGRTAHPDSRAILYEDSVYNMRKIKDFAETLCGFESVLKIVDIFKGVTVNSDLLRILVKPVQERGKFPANEMHTLLRQYREIFDERQAMKDGFIRPRKGIDAEYDSSKEDVARLESELEQYLRDMKRSTGINDLKYWGTNKDRYQIEVPMSFCNKVPREWTSKSQKKTHRRYWTPEIERLLAQLTAAEERVDLATKDTLRRLFEKFDNNKQVWSEALACASILDALISLVVVSSAPNYIWPEVLSPDNVSGPMLDIQDGRHPMLEHAFAQRSDGDYIPNSLSLGGVENIVNGSECYIPRLLLLSGPNMGGKSTLLRQTCLITILAQMGCKVPAARCRLTPVDRIFTRVGASDRILSGMSTFFVELAETAVILQTASKNSLCILDELGRGTATFDGTAIAHAVINHLVNTIGCRTLFATHYHSLVQGWDMDPRVKLGHMDCLVRSVAPIDTKEADMEEVTFLYRLCDGSSKRSYGLNVARLAQLPDEVLSLARQHSAQFEAKVNANAGATSDVGSADHFWWRELVYAYFEKLVSVANSGVPPHELVYVAAELWRRFSVAKHGH